MNVNVRVSLTDEQRNILKKRLTGKDVKAMVTRAEVNELVYAHIHSLLNEPLAFEHTFAPVVEEIELSNPPSRCSDECCRQNELLLARINRLQHKLDTRRPS